jgi:hypothetical protein
MLQLFACAEINTELFCINFLVGLTLKKQLHYNTHLCHHLLGLLGRRCHGRRPAELGDEIDGDGEDDGGIFLGRYRIQRL